MANDTADDALYYNAVALACGGDYGKLAKLFTKSGTWQGAHAALRKAGELRLPAEEAWKNMRAAGVGLVLPSDETYPCLLREIADPPFGIYVRGTLPAPDAPSIAIVGTRRATPDGIAIARRFARELAEAGLVVVSGLAFGIDRAAHEGCLDAQGRTVAILAGGLNSIYPREHVGLAGKILEARGAIISEYPFGAPPYSGRFLERNRIVSGIAHGTLIVEAPERSGSLATARYALEQNRDIFVVPGPITHPNFAGSNQLIRQGAELVASPQEILEAYGITKENVRAQRVEAASDEEKQVLQALREARTPVAIDKIAAMTKLEPRIVNRALAILSLANVVKETGAGYIMN